MDIEATKTAATQLLDSYYQIHTSDLPTQRTKSQWQAENKRGFFLGIIQEGEDSHIIRLHHLLATNQFTQQQEFSTTSQLADPQHHRTFIDDMFARYILPFHKDYSDTSTCHTPLSSNPPSRSNSAEDLDYVPEERELTHKDLKKAVEKRDGVCLFCWGNKQLEAAHIIAQKNIPMAYDEPSLLLRAGLTQKHQVQNGLFCWDKLQCHGAHIIAQKNIPVAYDEPSVLAGAGLKQKHQVQNGMLLCIKCHGEFDQLKRYVDVVDDDKLVVKVVNYSVLPNDEKHRVWAEATEGLKDDRVRRKRMFPELSDRQVLEPNGEMALYFVLNNPTKLPNRQALEFHKAACLIWRMAGGAESEDEHCPDDDDDYRYYVPVDYRSKSIEKWMDSSATLVIESTQ